MLPRTHLLKISEEDLSLVLPGMSQEQFAADALAEGQASSSSPAASMAQLHGPRLRR